MPGRVLQPFERFIEIERPPTPPRHGQDDPELHLVDLFSQKSGTQTPPQYPNVIRVDPLVRLSSEQSTRKRVEFAASETPLRSSRSLTNTPGNVGPLRPLPSSDNKPTKSILKPHDDSKVVKHSAQLFASHKYPNFAMMLESIVKQLAGPDRNSRIDSYVTFSNVLKASEYIPDLRALQGKINLVGDFILRDLRASKPGDTALASHALTLLASLIWKSEAEACLSHEFCTEIIEFAVSAFDASVPCSKDVIKHLLFIVGHQNFPTRVMTMERLVRILSSLQEVEVRVKGKSIIIGRLSVYSKILQQNKSAMLVNTTWIEHLFTDMLSSIKEIKSAAISFGFTAASQLGKDRKASRAMMNHMSVQQESGGFYGDWYAARLRENVKHNQDAVLIPRIWSIAVLFLRHKSQQLEHWQFIGAWVGVIQECFNAPDHDIKAAANHAWDHFVFAVDLGLTTREKFTTLLLQPLMGQLSQLTRKSQARNTGDFRSSNLASICNLLYYALPPGATFEQLDHFWDVYVLPLINGMISLASTAKPMTSTSPTQDHFANGQYTTHACDILESLLIKRPRVVYSATRALEDRLMQPIELPALDVRWTRKNSARIFMVLKPLTEKLFTRLECHSSELGNVWNGFLSSIAAAGAKEVKVSTETMAFFAQYLGMMSAIWRQGPGHLQSDPAAFLRAFPAINIKVVDALGILPFTEKLLSQEPRNTFAIVATPSHKSPSTATSTRTPFIHLVTLFAHFPPSICLTAELVSCASELIAPFFRARKNRSACIALAKELSQVIADRYESHSAMAMWEGIAIVVNDVLSGGITSDSNGSSDQPLGADYKGLVTVLETGSLMSPGDVSKAWIALLDTVCQQATREAGDMGKAIAVIEPLSKCLDAVSGRLQRPLSVSYLRYLVGHASCSMDKHALSSANRRMWNSSIVGGKQSLVEPYTYFYGFLRVSMIHSYNRLSVDTIDSCIDFVATATDHLRGTSAGIVPDVLEVLQEGIAMWITDSELKLSSSILADLRLVVRDIHPLRFNR